MKRAVESRLFLNSVTQSPGHISNIVKRVIHCVLSDVAKGFITGFGMPSYILGLEAMLETLRARRQQTRSGRRAD